jgi:hypothetical protein
MHSKVVWKITFPVGVIHEHFFGIGKIHYVHHAIPIHVPSTHIVNQEVIAILDIHRPATIGQRAAGGQQQKHAKEWKEPVHGMGQLECDDQNNEFQHQV